MQQVMRQMEVQQPRAIQEQWQQQLQNRLRQQQLKRQQRSLDPRTAILWTPPKLKRIITAPEANDPLAQSWLFEWFDSPVRPVDIASSRPNWATAVGRLQRSN
jgi:hypothetical protein